MKKCVKLYFFAFVILLGLLAPSFSVAAEEVEVIDDRTPGEKVVEESLDDKVVDSFEESVIVDEQEYIDNALATGDYEVQEDGSIVIYDKRGESEIGVKCIACVGGKWVIAKTSSSTVYGSWVACVESGDNLGGWLTCSKSVGYSHSYSGTLKVSKSAVEGLVGYSLTKSSDTTASYRVNVPKRERYQIQYRRIYKKDTVRQQYWVGKSLVSTSYLCLPSEI